VLLGSPAERAKLQPGDEILSFGGKGPEQIQKILRTKKPGDRVKIKYRRDGKKYEVDIVLDDDPGF
jgi:S1-C subfamily serine protease